MNDVATAPNEENVKAEIENLVTDIGKKNSKDFLKLAVKRLEKVQTPTEKDHDVRRKKLDELLA